MAAPLLPLLQQLAAELDALEPHEVLVLLVSRSDCPYCLEVRRNYLAPLLRSGAPRLRLRELEADRPQSAPALARLKVRFFPTVLFLGREGRQLTEPLVGLDQAGFYGGYLDARLQQALAAA